MPIILPVDAGRVGRKKRDKICKTFFGNVLHDFGKKNISFSCADWVICVDLCVGFC